MYKDWYEANEESWLEEQEARKWWAEHCHDEED